MPAPGRKHDGKHARITAVAFSLRKKTAVPALEPAPLPKRKPSADDLRQLVEGMLGCELHPSHDSDETCGDPPRGQAHLYIRHEAGCPARRKFAQWLCRHHLDMAMLGNIQCRDCGAGAAVIRVLEHSI